MAGKIIKATGTESVPFHNNVDFCVGTGRMGLGGDILVNDPAAPHLRPVADALEQAVGQTRRAA